MDSSPHRASSISDEFSPSLLTEQEVDVEETEPHIHLPNPSYWPILLGLAIATAMVGLLFISSAAWIVPIAVVLVLVCILGWALEDPMTPLKEKFVSVYQAGSRLARRSSMPMESGLAEYERALAVISWSNAALSCRRCFMCHKVLCVTRAGTIRFS